MLRKLPNEFGHSSKRELNNLVVYFVYFLVFMRIDSYLQHLHCVEFNCLFPFTPTSPFWIMCFITRHIVGQYLGLIYNGNWPEWSALWSEIICVISKSNECAARVRFGITSMISDQSCTTRSSIAPLLHPFWNRTI